ncbi:LysR family transcriptional regulator [Paenibacillus spongiae]|uniref:LysR family transcriptional regulator n=1 Tax=Paenibacillus spongiae TaxID=2909671 RepID=A0ABY5S789_9BACL|nr:LysR family transcriptional regulator [Paenibacillus spongiae]UVI29776.1 LysR family transcriptional regulator [Paenibacillus spongiae]
MLEKLDGRIVQTFIAVYEERSISRAAERLGYVQSTVTIQLRTLEEAFGEKLFERLPRGVEPTEAGMKAAPFFYRFIQLGEVMQEAMLTRDEPSGEVRIRVLESFCVTQMPMFFRHFLEQHPQIRIRTETGFQKDITEELLKHRIDYGIVPIDPQIEQIVFYPLVQDELVCVIPDSLASRELARDRASLEREPVISFGSRCIYHTFAAQALAGAGIGLQEQLEFGSLQMVKQMVKEGMGLAMLPLSSVRSEVERGELHILVLEKTIPLQHGLIVHKERLLGTAANLFRDAVLEWFQVKG